MNEIRKLAGQTVIYGFGTVVPRFLNYALLTPFYTYLFSNIPDGTEQYGVVTELYAWMVLVLVFLTYGMETAYFRFAGKKADKDVVYSTSLVSLFITSAVFILLIFLFIKPISTFIGYETHKDYIKLFAWIVAIDAFSAIPFAYLRGNNRPVVFSALKILNVVITVSLVFFFLKLAPSLYEKGNKWIINIYDPSLMVRYIFIANLAGSAATLLFLLPYIIKIKFSFNGSVLRKMLKYSWPLLVGGLAGSLNEVLDKILMKRLIGEEDGLSTVGIYGAGFKVGVIMSLFIQMYRFAAEPFFFEKAGKNDAKETYAVTMKYFVIASLILFLCINLYINQIQFIIGPVFRESLIVVPIISMGYLLLGIFINQSIWYKVDDKTIYGAIITIFGAGVTVIINVLFVPGYGYIAAAWAHVACYASMVIISYLIGMKLYPVKYETGKIMTYMLLAIILVIIGLTVQAENKLLNILWETSLITAFCVVIEWRERFFSLILRIRK